MAERRRPAPRCIVIAGPNGAGKTTFAREFLVQGADIVHYVNADLIAAGLAPLHPGSASLAAGKLFLREIDRLAKERADFSFESTLSGLGIEQRLVALKAAGYRLELIYLALPSVALALRRVAVRVKQGGHDVASEDVRRRFTRSMQNLRRYLGLFDDWVICDNSGDVPKLMEKHE